VVEGCWDLGLNGGIDEIVMVGEATKRESIGVFDGFHSSLAAFVRFKPEHILS